MLAIRRLHNDEVNARCRYHEVRYKLLTAASQTYTLAVTDSAYRVHPFVSLDFACLQLPTA